MPMHPLGQLIAERMEHPDNRWSLNDVVRRMKAAGHYGIGKSRLGQIRNNPVESLKSHTIFALADGLGVTPLTVANAALESMGVRTRPSEVTDSAVTIRIDPTLSDANRRHLLALVREMRTRSPHESQPVTPKRGLRSAVAGAVDEFEVEDRDQRRKQS